MRARPVSHERCQDQARMERAAAGTASSANARAMHLATAAAYDRLAERFTVKRP